MGDFLVFHYIQDQHFVVQIYGSSGDLTINFYNSTWLGKKRPRTNSTATSHDELSPGTDINGDTGERPIVPQDHMGLTSNTSLKSAENGVKGKVPNITEKDGQGYHEAEMGINKAIKSEPADSGDTSFPDAGIYSCLLRVDGQNFLELPQSWPEFVVRRKNKGKIIIYLKGPDNRCWPVIYQENCGSKFLTGNWTSFTEVYGLKPGDECLFQLPNQLERVFTVQVTNHKVDVTQNSLS